MCWGRLFSNADEFHSVATVEHTDSEVCNLILWKRPRVIKQVELFYWPELVSEDLLLTDPVTGTENHGPTNIGKYKLFGCCGCYCCCFPFLFGLVSFSKTIIPFVFTLAWGPKSLSRTSLDSNLENSNFTKYSSWMDRCNYNWALPWLVFTVNLMLLETLQGRVIIYICPVGMRTRDCFDC